MGHTTLHVDTAKYYGGDWAAFTWEGLQGWMSGDEIAITEEENKIELDEGEELVALGDNKTILNVKENWHCDNIEESKKCEGDTAIVKETSTTVDDDCQETVKEVPLHQSSTDNQQKWDRETLLSQSRKFNLDLTPRLLFARGPMVELLISSNISRYTEFKSVTRVLTMLEGKLEQVPSSRSDVFNTRHISVVEKRILIKFLTQCLQEEEADLDTCKTFGDYLKSHKLTPNLTHFVVHSIAMSPLDCPLATGLLATRKFLSSLGRFGPTPFLWSMYGTGELPQAFCRLCAVFGGVYYLGRSLDGVVVKEGRARAVVTEGQRIGCDNLVLADSRMSSRLEPQLSRSTVCTSRGIYIATSSVLPAEKEQLTFLSIPPTEERPHPIMAVEVSAGAAACPRDLHLLHASCKTMTSPASDLSPVISTLHPVPQETLAYSLTFSQTTRTSSDPSTALANVFCASGPTPQLDFDYSISEAKEIYRRIYPEEEFLPRAPDPEEIIIGEQGDKAGEPEGKETIEEEAEKSAETGGNETVGEQNEKSAETGGNETVG